MTLAISLTTFLLDLVQRYLHIGMDHSNQDDKLPTANLGHHVE